MGTGGIKAIEKIVVVVDSWSNEEEQEKEET